MWRPTVASDELWHHGILGQRYGVRNGPPYPLDGSDHNSEEKKHGWKQSLKAKDTKARHKELAKKYKSVRKANEEKPVKKEHKPLFKKTYASRKETKKLLKMSKNPYFQRDMKEFGKMSAEEFQKEKAARKKAYDSAERELKVPSKNKGEWIAKRELAETAFNRYITMSAYEREIEKMRGEYNE